MQTVVDELRELNPSISPDILRRTVYHVANIGDGAAPDTVEVTTFPPIMFAECQAYMDGFSAAIDGDYSPDDIEWDPRVSASDELKNRLGDFGDILPSYMLAIATHYAGECLDMLPLDVERQFADAIPVVAACGFVNGLSAGMKELESGHVFKPVHVARPESFFSDIASDVIDDAIGDGHDDLRTLAVTYMKELSSRKISTKSGRSRFSPETERECLYVYGTGFVHGIMAGISGLEATPWKNHELKDAFSSARSEVQSFCYVNGYGEDVFDSSVKHAEHMIDELACEDDDDGMYVLDAWGYADGLAAITATPSDQESLE